jgi:hypothetical protein
VGQVRHVANPLADDLDGLLVLRTAVKPDNFQLVCILVF